MICNWCGEEDEACWCSCVSESFKRGETDNDYEEISIEGGINK